MYGELEYWFALIKILITIVFIIIGMLKLASSAPEYNIDPRTQCVGICVASGGLGGQVIGFKYWQDPGAFVNGGLGTVSVLLSAGFSFQGTEIGTSVKISDAPC